VRLGEKQKLFAIHFWRLLRKMERDGYEYTINEIYRSPEEAARRGFTKTLHTKKLAADVNLFLDGRYLRATKHHKSFGEWWEKQHELARWGGRFGDGNHYSFTHGGIR